MALSIAPYTGNGSTTSYAIPFPRLSNTHLVVTINGTTKVLGTDFNISTDTLTFVTAPANASAIVIKRVTPVSAPQVNWTDGSRFREVDADSEGLQMLYASQEAKDRIDSMDANGDGVADTAAAVPWTGITGKPSTFAPSAHTHPISDVTGLQTALDGKAALSHTHIIANITGLQAALDAASTIGNGDMLRATYDPDLDGKVVSSVNADVVPWTGITGKPTTFTPSAHTHIIADVTGLQTALDGKAALVHTHVIADTTGLQTALDGKAALVHVHAGADITSGTVATARLGSGTANSTTFLHGDQAWAVLLAADIPNLDTSKLTTGTLATARLGSGTASASTFLHGDSSWAALVAGDIPNHSAALLTSGTVGTARLGSGTASASTFLHGDSSWAALVAGDIPSLNASIIGAGTMATARLGSGTASSSTALFGDQTYKTVVTSVALTSPAELTAGGTPITGAGTLTLTWATQAINLVFAGPGSGSSAAPTFRSLVANDIPSLDAAKISTGTLGTARLGSGVADSTKFLRGDQTWQVFTSGTVTSLNITAPASGITASGGPITSSGAITLALADDLAAIEALSGTGYVKRTGTSTWSVGTAVDINSDTTGLLTLTRLATQANNTVVGNVSGSTASPIALSATQVTALLNAFVGDTGSGGTKGAVPAPATGDATKFLKGDGTWGTPTAGITGSGTSGRVTVWTGSSAIGDDAAFLFSSASSVGTLTLGNAANGIVKGGAKLILQTTSNGDIELTPNGTGNVNVTTNQLLVPAGSQGAPAIRIGSSNNNGLYVVAGLTVMTAGGGNAISASGSNVSIGTGMSFNVIRGNINGSTDGSPASSYFWSTTGGSGTNVAGASLLIRSGAGTGTANSGSVRLQNGFPGASSSTSATNIDRLFINAVPKSLTNSSNNSLFEVALAAGEMCGGSVSFTIIATDGTDDQAYSGVVNYSSVNKGGTFTVPALSVIGGSTSASGISTLTATFDIVAGTNKVTFRVNPMSSLTTTTYQIIYTITNNSKQAITIL